MEEWWCGKFVNKNTRLDWWYLDDMWVISSRYQPNIIQKSHTYHPGIIHISTTHIAQISPTYHTNIIDISPTYHPKITRSIFFTTPHLMKRQVLTQIWSKKLHFIIRLRLYFSSSRYYPNIIQKSSRNHPVIIQKSSKNHPVDIDFYNPQLVEKSSLKPDMALLLQVKIPLLKGINQVLLDFNEVFVCWVKYMVKYSGCTPMYYKLRVHTNGHLKSSLDYWRQMVTTLLERGTFLQLF